MNWLQQKAEEQGSTNQLPFRAMCNNFIDVWNLSSLGPRDIVVTKMAEFFRNKWRSQHKKYFTAANRPKAERPNRASRRANNSKYNLPTIRKGAHDTHISECSKKEKEAFDFILETHSKETHSKRPPGPKFNTATRGFMDQFRIGHYKYWKEHKLSHGKEAVSAQILKAIRQLYRWHKGNRPYTEPKAGGSRQAPTLAQVEQLCWERKIATKKQNRQLPARDQTPKSEG
uniref:Uncharacterized protein n=1 Tax=Eutreptiella gymnastica TaxID=73025 RepID=A0A7S1IBU7_9EUGL|mmetsp:Transcript_145730/g.254391  ORF Transcript_145730/g.254391 Transcript_145730/m.254391 type:complete len:229 (+) Transcript_145730:199-885(+)